MCFQFRGRRHVCPYGTWLMRCVIKVVLSKWPTGRQNRFDTVANMPTAYAQSLSRGQHRAKIWWVQLPCYFEDIGTLWGCCCCCWCGCQDDDRFLKSLFAKLTDDDTPDSTRRDLTLFLKEFCTFSQTLAQQSKDGFFKVWPESYSLLLTS